MIVAEAAGATDIGKKRSGNEDFFSVNPALSLYIVADGMGGHQAGEVASELVVKTMNGYIENCHKNGQTEKLSDYEYDTSLSFEANNLNSSLALANRVVYEVSKSKNMYRGMGSTVSAIYFSGDNVIAANVGDSPIYLIRSGVVETISVPHTVIAEQMAIDPESVHQLAKNYRHMLTRAIGIEQLVKADICEFPCFKDDVIVIASDGLTDKASPHEIMETIQGLNPEEACQSLINLANERGGDDNITVLIVKVKSVQRSKSGGILGWIARLFFKQTK